MRFIGILATILFAWWAANQAAVYLLFAFAPEGESLGYLLQGARFIYWGNILFGLGGVLFLAWKAFGKEAPK